MTTDHIKLLRNIKIDHFSSFCDFNDYNYTQHITCTACISNMYHPTSLANSCNGVFLIDYTKTVKHLLDNPKFLDSRSNVNYFIVANRNKPDLSRYDVYYIKNLTIKQAQTIIDANVAAFTQYNTAIIEQNLIKTINEI